MSRYWKFWAAMLGVVAQVAVVAADSLDKGLVPPSWAPWVRVGLAVATALAVLGAPKNAPGRVPVGRHEAVPAWGATFDDGAGGDSGRARVPVLTVVLVAALVAASAGPAAARLDGTHPRPVASSTRSWAPVVHPQVVSAGVCDVGVLVVRFDGEFLADRSWVPLLDDGSTRLELLDGSGREVDAGHPDGRWEPPEPEGGPVVSGGEHTLRWAGWAWADGHGLHYYQARVVTGGYTSTAVPVEGGCPE